MYNGYTESQTQTESRALRMFEDYKINFQLTHTTESEADAVANMVDTAEASEVEAGGVDVQDAVNWQDAPEYKEAQQVSDNFNFETVAEQEF